MNVVFDDDNVQTAQIAACIITEISQNFAIFEKRPFHYWSFVIE